MSNKEKILSLFNTGEPKNFKLAIQLAKANGIDLAFPEYMELFDWLESKGFVKSAKNPGVKIKRMIVLKKVHASGLSEDDYPPNLGLLPYLKEVSLGKKHLPKVMDELLKLKYLEILTSVNSELTELSPKITQLTQLKQLVLRGNSLSELPKGFENMQELVRLDLGYNKFTQLPVEIADLTNLTYLSFWHNEAIKSIPNEYYQLKKLKRFGMGDTALSQLDAFKFYREMKCTNSMV